MEEEPPIPPVSMGARICGLKAMAWEEYKSKPISHRILLVLSSAAMLVAFLASLVFSALFGYILVKNKLNTSIENAIVIITAAITIIALDSDSDRYGNVTKKQYIIGFVWDILGSALHGLIFALSELLFVKLLGRRSLPCCPGATTHGFTICVCIYHDRNDFVTKTFWEWHLGLVLSRVVSLLITLFSFGVQLLSS